MFDRKRVGAWWDGVPYIVTAETYGGFAPDVTAIEEEFMVDADGKEVCFVPHLAASGVVEACAREIDAKEYGIRPQTRRELVIFREVRGLRNQHEREAMKRRSEQARGGQ